MPSLCVCFKKKALLFGNESPELLTKTKYIMGIQNRGFCDFYEQFNVRIEESRLYITNEDITKLIKKFINYEIFKSV